MQNEREAEKAAKIKEAEDLRLKQEADAKEAELVKTLAEAAGEVLVEQMTEFTKGLMKNREGVTQNSTVPTIEGEQIKQESEKIDELARMLGGLTNTEQTLSHAKELLKESHIKQKIVDMA